MRCPMKSVRNIDEVPEKLNLYIYFDVFVGLVPRNVLKNRVRCPTTKLI